MLGSILGSPCLGKVPYRVTYREHIQRAINWRTLQMSPHAQQAASHKLSYATNSIRKQANEVTRGNVAVQCQIGGA